MAVAKFSFILLRSKASSHRVLRDVDGDEKLQQVVGAASFGADAGHAVAAERMSLDESPCDLAIEVQVAHFEFVASPAKCLRAATVNTAGQGVLSPIGDLEGFIQILRLHDAQNRSEDLILSNR